MRRLGDLFPRLYRGFKKIAVILRQRVDLIEVKILLTGLSLAALAGLHLLFLLFTNPDLYGTLFSTAVVHVMGGRALGIATCLSAGISLFYTIVE